MPFEHYSCSWPLTYTYIINYVVLCTNHTQLLWFIAMLESSDSGEEGSKEEHISLYTHTHTHTHTYTHVRGIKLILILIINYVVLCTSYTQLWFSVEHSALVVLRWLISPIVLFGVDMVKSSSSRSLGKRATTFSVYTCRQTNRHTHAQTHTLLRMHRGVYRKLQARDHLRNHCGKLPTARPMVLV